MDQQTAAVQLGHLTPELLALIKKTNRRSPAKKLRANKKGTPQLSSYTRAALDGEVDRVRSAPEGTRNDTLNRAAFSLGQFVAVNELPRTLAEDELFAAAQANGIVGDDGDASVRATIASGLNAGLDTPRDEGVDSQSRSEHGSKRDERPEIRITTEVADVVDAATAALVQHAHGQIFQKGGLLVRVLRDGRKMKGLSAHPRHLLSRHFRMDAWLS